MLNKSQKLLLKKMTNKCKHKKLKKQISDLFSILFKHNEDDYYKKLIDGYTNEINTNINTFKNEATEKENQYNRFRIDSPIDAIAKVILILSLVIISFFASGYWQSKIMKSIDIVENTSCFSESALDCAVIYQNNEYIILSPCYITDNKIYINTSYQYRTEIYKTNKHSISIQEIKIDKLDDLDCYRKDKQ